MRWEQASSNQDRWDLLEQLVNEQEVWRLWTSTEGFKLVFDVFGLQFSILLFYFIGFPSLQILQSSSPLVDHILFVFLSFVFSTRKSLVAGWTRLFCSTPIPAWISKSHTRSVVHNKLSVFFWRCLCLKHHLLNICMRDNFYFFLKNKNDQRTKRTRKQTKKVRKDAPTNLSLHISETLSLPSAEPLAEEPLCNPPEDR